MSQSQQQSRRGEKKQYRRPARPGGTTAAQPQKQYQRVDSSIKDGGGQLPSANATATSFKKHNGQGGHSNAKPETASSTISETTIAQSDARSESFVSVNSNVTASETPVKSIKNCTTPPKPQSSDLASGTMATGAGDAERDVSLQFGSFSPSFVNVMKIPPRTNSAPPNMDEQKKKEANLGSVKTDSVIQGTSQTQPRDYMKQLKTETPPKRDTHAPIVTCAMPFPIPHQQPHMPLNYGVPTSQIQGQGMTNTPLHMPMPLPFPGPGFHPQGLIHQGQGLNFFPQINHQLGPPHFGNSNIGPPPRFIPPHIRNSPQRRAVKITHPKTNEELKLDEGVNRNLAFQIPHMPYDLPQTMNYFSHIPPPPVIIQSPTSVLSTNSQTPPSPLRFNSSGVHMSSNTETAPSDGSPNGKKILLSSQSYNHKEGSKIHHEHSNRFSRTNPESFNGTKGLDTMNNQSKITSKKDLQAESSVKTSSETSREIPVTTEATNKSFDGLKSQKSGESSIDSLKTVNGHESEGGSEPINEGVKIGLKYGSKNKPALYKVKSDTSKGKKKRKEFLQKADAAGSTSDIYVAFKDSDDKPESVISSESKNSDNNISASSNEGSDSAKEDDWENAATPKLVTPKINKVGPGKSRHSEEGKKRYTRDFCLTLSGQFTDLPSGFKIAYDLVDVIMDSSVNVPIDGNNNSLSRSDYRFDDNRWNKSSGPDPRGENTHRGFRPGPGGFRNQRQYVNDSQYNNGFQKVFNHVQSPLLSMHKAEKKYEIRKVTDEEEAKQRQLKAILNKLTPQNFERLFEQVKEVNIGNAGTLFGVISQIFDKALMEPTFCEMYANFCYHLAGELPDFVEDDEKITFKRLLLNKCQEEFERHEREQAEEDDKIGSRKRMLGNIRLIGELYKKKMLTERIMHECIHKLLGQYQNPDEEDIEALCKLMSTIGEMIDHNKAKQHMDAYFEIMSNLSDDMKLSSRLRFMLKDVIDLRNDKWQERRKVEGPKKIEELHRDAALERRGGIRGPTFRRGPDTRPNIFSHPSRGVASQTRRPLLHKGSDSGVMLGPQGGLAKGMSSRGGMGMGMVSGPPLMDPPRYPHEIYTRPAFHGPARFTGHSSPPSPSRVTSLSEKGLSEERLNELSMTTIREFYSARDEKEVILCVKDLNAPSFYPTMLSSWINDSFERKDRDRDILARLLVNLAKPGEGILNTHHLTEGFQSVLAGLEDAVTDAPKAATYLGYTLGRIIIENIVSLSEIGRLLTNGGEEPGQLVKNGLAYEVLESAFELIRSDKGESAVNEMCKNENMHLEDFRPSNSHE